MFLYGQYHVLAWTIILSNEKITWRLQLQDMYEIKAGLFTMRIIMIIQIEIPTLFNVEMIKIK